MLAQACIQSEYYEKVVDAVRFYSRTTREMQPFETLVNLIYQRPISPQIQVIIKQEAKITCSHNLIGPTFYPRKIMAATFSPKERSVFVTLGALHPSGYSGFQVRRGSLNGGKIQNPGKNFYQIWILKEIPCLILKDCTLFVRRTTQPGYGQALPLPGTTMNLQIVHVRSLKSSGLEICDIKKINGPHSLTCIII